LKYLPFLKGKYSTAPGLLLMQQAEQPGDKLVFQIDETYDQYLQNKKNCRTEDINKYYTQARLFPDTAVAVNRYLVTQLVLEYPSIFFLNQTQKGYELQNRQTGESIEWQNDWLETKNQTYLTLFDALCCQVPEDIAICQLSGDQDWLAALHLCAPNHWAAQDKIGKTFGAVHAAIPEMEKTNRHYFKMLELLVQKGPYTRFAWGISTDNRLNHHPEPPPYQNPDLWQGRQIEPDTKHLYVRVERQNLIGLPQVNAFIFTIRTYFYHLVSLEKPEKTALLAAIESMTDKSQHYKGIAGKTEILRSWLT
jgi:dimethylamine monooxygenase subunit A